jgi:hypothetical protein
LLRIATSRSHARHVGEEQHPGRRVRLHEGVRDVVALADIGEPEAVRTALVPSRRQQVGRRLALVVVAGEGVDDGDACGVRSSSGVACADVRTTIAAA